MFTARRAAALALTALALGGCSSATIEGTVESVYGEALPGVAVKVQGQHAYAVSNANGAYSLAYQPGDLVLEFIKSGYAPAEMELPLSELRTVAAAPVSMWRLPANIAVYIYEENKYRETTAAQVESFQTEDAELYGARRDVERNTENPEPFLVLHRLAPEGIAMHRLERQSIVWRQEGAQATEIEAYIAVEAVPIGAVPLDYPARLLHRVTLPGSLVPGVYAIHWGALEGHDDYDPRRIMHMFEVFDPASGPAPALSPGNEEDAADPADLIVDDGGPSQG